jgi:hypothetical protein
MMQGIEIEPSLRDVLAEETEALQARLHDTDSRARYGELLDAIQAGRVPEVLLAPLERLLELGLQTGRVRRVHSPQAESSYLRLYHKTPRGQTIVKAVDEANTALQALSGQVLEDVAFHARGPGVYQLVIQTEQFSLAIETRPEGIWVRELGVGLE